jgi:plastocyanin
MLRASACLVALVAVAACGDDDGGQVGDAGPDAHVRDAGGDGGHSHGDAGGDGGQNVALNGCTSSNYIDKTATGADRTITWQDSSSAKPPNSCLKISMGQAVKWMGDLSAASHPLRPFGGDAGSPIVATSSGTEVTFTFNATGVFGFHCDNHDDMTGAIWVVP